jgi:hypothetical protein
MVKKRIGAAKTEHEMKEMRGKLEAWMMMRRMKIGIWGIIGKWQIGEGNAFHEPCDYDWKWIVNSGIFEKFAKKWIFWMAKYFSISKRRKLCKQKTKFYFAATYFLPRADKFYDRWDQLQQQWVILILGWVVRWSGIGVGGGGTSQIIEERAIKL